MAGNPMGLSLSSTGHPRGFPRRSPQEDLPGDFDQAGDFENKLESQKSSPKLIFGESAISRNSTFLVSESTFMAKFYHGVTRTPPGLVLSYKV
jgi:hypothetical protein